MSEEKLHLLIKGRVQGIGFRWFAVDHARRLDLAGWVRNTREGAVEVCAAGSAAALTRFREAISQGPDGSRVTEVVEVPDSTAETVGRPFKIVR